MVIFSSKIKNFRLQFEKQQIRQSKFLAKEDIGGGN